MHQKNIDYSTGELTLFNIARVIILESKVLFLDDMNENIASINAKKITDVIDEVSKDKRALSINHYGELLPYSKRLNIEKKG